MLRHHEVDGDDGLYGGWESSSGTATDAFEFGLDWGNDVIGDFDDASEKIDLSATGLTFRRSSNGPRWARWCSRPRGTIQLYIPVADVTAEDFVFA